MIRPDIHTQLSQWLHHQWLVRGWLSLAMLPFSWIVLAILSIRRCFYRIFPSQVYHASVPVLVIGNIYVGGTGKTPVLIALVNALKQKGWHPGVISRGYGVKIGPMPRTGQGALDPTEFADEPALIARQSGAPIAVHPNRRKAIEALLTNSPEVNLIISDDGLQHLALARDMEIIVQDQRGAGNARVMPAGPLRESTRRLSQVQAIITNVPSLPAEPLPASRTTRQDAALTAHCSHPQNNSAPRTTYMALRAVAFRHLTSLQSLSPTEFKLKIMSQTLGAAAGIGMPERFFNSLRQQGLTLAESLALPDHHSFDADTFSTFKTQHILITAKDAIKCEQLNDTRLWVVEVDAVFSDAGFTDWLSATLQKHACKGSHNPAESIQ
ncbi:MAG: tetraacyldisaccharide 4'-kinase [Sheuella sp.]|nr:tetraacyldisaccharide 4'-kinase [Sheuella sp.]